MTFFPNKGNKQDFPIREKKLFILSKIKLTTSVIIGRVEWLLIPISNFMSVNLILLGVILSLIQPPYKIGL